MKMSQRLHHGWFMTKRGTLMRCVLALLPLLLISMLHASHATADVESDYERLSRIPARYQTFGTICEYLTMLRLEEAYPADEYDIEVGIQYEVGGRVIGEIDVVVFREQDHEAVLVGQVKCSRNMGSANRHAREQNDRFFKTMARAENQHEEVLFTSTSKPELEITDDQMDEVKSYITASQDGGKKHGFTMTIGHSLATVVDMRNKLLACQADGDCPRP